MPDKFGVLLENEMSESEEGSTLMTVPCRGIKKKKHFFTSLDVTLVANTLI